MNQLPNLLPESDEEGFEPLSRVREFVYHNIPFDSHLSKLPGFYWAVYYTIRSWKPEDTPEVDYANRRFEVIAWLILELRSTKRRKCDPVS